MRQAGFIAVLAATLTVMAATPTSAASLTVAWDANADGLTTGYYVYYGTTSRTYSARVDAGPLTSFTVTGLADNTKYFLAIRAYDKSGVLSDLSLEVSATTPLGPVGPPPPGAGARLTAAVRSDRYIDISWVPATGDTATSFRVEVGTLPGFTAYSAFTTDRSISFDMTDLGVPAYFIRVRSVYAGVPGVVSNEVAMTPAVISPPTAETPTAACVAPPGAPRRFLAAARGTAVTLTWQSGLGDAPTGYVLEVGSAPGLKNLMTVPLAAMTGLSAMASNGVYAIRLLAANACGMSTWGAESILTVSAGLVAPPGPPQNPSGQVSGRSVSLLWGPPSSGGAVSYYVIEATTAAGAVYTFNTGSTTSSAGFTGVPPGQYVVRFRAGNAAGVGPASAAVAITVY